MFRYPTLSQELVLYSPILTTLQSVRFGGLLMYIVSPGISIEPNRKEDYSEYLLKKIQELTIGNRQAFLDWGLEHQ